jgi:hypothetical protein
MSCGLVGVEDLYNLKSAGDADLDLYFIDISWSSAGNGPVIDPLIGD